MRDAILYETKPFQPRANSQQARNGHDPDMPPKFALEPWSLIAFEGHEEWLIKRVLPRRGLAAIYGKPGSLKSFVVSHIALCVALELEWAGRRVSRVPVVYIAAEEASGLRKRKAGYCLARPDLPTELPIYLVSTAPNLGADPGDLEILIANIKAAKVLPGLIILDTLAQTLGAADENGAGMTVFTKNAAALAARFNALVLIVHHVGLGDSAQQRMRGHSSLNGAMDAQILCERDEGELSATLTLQKLKDEASDVRLTARLSRVVIGRDEDGEEISTLVVDAVEDAEKTAETPRPKLVPATQRLLMSVVTEAIDATGKHIKPFADGPLVHAAPESRVRDLYFARIAERAEDDEDEGKLYNRQRMSFKRAVESALKSETLIASDKEGERHLWLP